MNARKKGALALVGAAALLPIAALTARQALSSDHADTPEIAASPGTDLSDVFVFPSPTNANNVVLALCVSPLIPAGGTRSFDPNVLYQFKIDNTGDHVEDLVIQATFSATGDVSIAGPARPKVTGTSSELLDQWPTNGRVGTAFSPTANMQVFAGVREDPFFFDLEQFFTILPDRGYPVFPTLIQPTGQENTPRATTWRAPGVAKDFLKDMNLLAIVVELPKSALRGSTNGKIALWCTTSK